MRSRKCHKAQPKHCTKCEAEAKKAQEDMQRALALQEKRDREEKDYSDHLAKLDAMLANERKRIRDEQLSEERSRQIEQKEQDLARAKEMTISRPDSVRQPHGSIDAELGTQPRLPKPGKTMLKSNVEPQQHATRPLLGPEQKSDSEWEYKRESQAKDLWEQQKRVENIRNDAIDSLMETIGLEEVKTQILRIKAKIDASLRQNADMKQDRLNVAFLGNPGTGSVCLTRHIGYKLTTFFDNRQDYRSSLVREDSDIFGGDSRRCFCRDHRLPAGP